MAVKKKQSIVAANSNYDQMKEEIILLLTGQDPDREGDFDYAALVKRAIILLIAVYGVSRVGILRQLALSIATTVFTRWLAQKATDAIVRTPELQRINKA